MNIFANNKFNRILDVAIFLISPLVLVLILEYLNRITFSGSYPYFIELAAWLVGSWGKYILGYLIVLAIQLIFLSIFNNVYLAVLLNTVIVILIYLINYYKIKLLGEAFLPWDLKLIDQLWILLPNLYKEINFGIFVLVSFCVILLITFIIKFANFNLFNWKVRTVLFSCSLGSILLIGNYPNNLVGSFFEKVNIYSVPENQINHSNINGVILGYLLNVPISLNSKPSNYDEDFINEEILSLKYKGERIHEIEFKPNIVVIMSESFWDIGNLSNEISSEKYLPTVKENQVGHIISPQFGGGTANVEFEALTSLSMNFLPKGAIPYMQYVNSSTPSIASFLSDLGYYSVGIHTFGGDFWKRNIVYPLLGFDEFKSYSDFENLEIKGDFVADSEITNIIINKLSKIEEPSFLFAVTMQNHGGYSSDRYGKDTVNVPSDYSDKSRQILNTYTTGIVDADYELNRLIGYLDKFEEPTLVVFFGDHLPGLKELYDETEFLKYDTLSDELKMKRIPLAVWNNYNKDIHEVGEISTSFLAPRILEWAGINGSSYYNFISSFYSELPVFTHDVKSSYEGTLYEKTPKHMKSLENIYEAVQYDILFGDKLLDKKDYFIQN